MDATLHCTAPCSRQERSVHTRSGVANTMDRFKGLESPWTSPRQIAGQLHVPARTLNYWIHRERSFINHSSWPERTARFFETPEGIDVLHRLMAAAHLVFVEGNDCGLRNLSWFLKLSRLSEFVASSYGAQQAAAEELESLLICFGQEEGSRLAQQMPAREITLCEDETFHPQICLVAIEPVSNFILVEQYQPQRDTATWEQCTGAQLAALPVTVFQVTSDAAKALIAHAETSLGAHHSPDLFHVQYDTVKATSGALASQTRAAVRELEERQAKDNSRREKGLPDPLVDAMQRAQRAETAAQERVDTCRARQERAQAARQGLGRDYHPVDLQTGQPLTAGEVGQRLAGHFDTLDQVAAQAGLSAHACDKFAKARRVLNSMQATIAFFWTMVASRLAGWGYSPAVQEWMQQDLIPAYYLRRVAEKARNAEEKQRLRILAAEVLARARSPDGLWGTLPCDLQADLETKARQCADFFQRSSSCVEGRNGQLSLRHHALHHLTARKLKALTVLHNYAVQREDGSTAASRFYGGTPRDLFGWLLKRLSLPGRPRLVRRSA